MIRSPAAARTSAAPVATLGLVAASWALAIRQMDEMGTVAGLGSLIAIWALVGIASYAWYRAHGSVVAGVSAGNHPADVRRSPSPRNDGAVLTTRREQ